MDNKKVNITAPPFLIEVLEKDANHFKLAKSRLYNLIFVKCALKFRSNYSQEFRFEKNKTLQFHFNKENEKIFNGIIKDQPELSNSEIMREIFLSYAVLPSFLRETTLFREKISFIMTSQKEYRVLKIRTPDGITEGRIEKLFRDKQENYFKIKIAGRDYFISQCEIIS